MLRAELYEVVYLIALFIFTVLVSIRYSGYPQTRVGINQTENPFVSLILCLATILFIGFRPVSPVFVDMMGYYYQWDTWDFGEKTFFWDQQNLIFDNLRIFMSTSHLPARSFIVLISFIYFGLMWWACRRMFPSDTLLAFLVCLGAFSTFAYGTNGIKAGAAASFFLLALSYFDKRIISALLAIISIGFHHSMIMVVGCYLIVCIYHKPKLFFAIWALCFILAAAHVTYFQSVFNSLADEQGQMYLSGQEFGKGFRIDFILYSFMPVLVGYYAVFKKKIKSKHYNIVLCLYLLTNSVWMLCMYAEFTNRIAYLSWFLYPIVLIYPFIKEEWATKQYQTVGWISVAHIAFTMFMFFIYY